MRRHLIAAPAAAALALVVPSISVSTAWPQIPQPAARPLRPEAAARPRSSELPSWADSFAVITPGRRYARGGLWAAIAGRHYRDLWITPVQVPVLDLHRYAGGLTPNEAHTGSQTKSIRFAGADGREYQFRSVDKDPTAWLAPELQGTAYAKALQDGVSASFPAAPLVANPLLQAAGVLAEQDTLALIPDDPALGEFRSEFKGVLGVIEMRSAQRPSSSLPNATPRRGRLPPQLGFQGRGGGKPVPQFPSSGQPNQEDIALEPVNRDLVHRAH